MKIWVPIIAGSLAIAYIATRRERVPTPDMMKARFPGGVDVDPDFDALEADDSVERASGWVDRGTWSFGGVLEDGEGWLAPDRASVPGGYDYGPNSGDYTLVDLDPSTTKRDGSLDIAGTGGARRSGSGGERRSGGGGGGGGGVVRQISSTTRAGYPQY